MANFDMSQIDLGGAADIDGFLESTGSEGGGVHTTSTILQQINIPAQPEFELAMLETQGTPGLDALFQQQPKIVQASHKRRVASLTDLRHFTRISADTLIHRSEKDLWSISKEADGQLYIERLFDDNGEPLKG